MKLGLEFLERKSVSLDELMTLPALFFALLTYLSVPLPEWVGGSVRDHISFARGRKGQ